MDSHLRQKSILAYTLIGLLFIAILSLTIFFILTEKSAANNINITGKQQMFIQRIALLCNNYYNNQTNKKIKYKIEGLLNTLENNHKLIKAINSQDVQNVLYSPYYQYDKLLTNYIDNTAIFLTSTNDKNLKIINYTNESLLAISGTLVDLLTADFEEFVSFLIGIILISSVFFMAALYFVYKMITLQSILATTAALSEIKENEAFIKSILDNSALSIITTTPDGIITSFNNEAETLLGYKKEDLINKKTPAVFHKLKEVKQRAAVLSEQFKSFIEPGFDVFVEKTKRNLKNSDEWIYVAKNGKEYPVKLSITALKNAKGEVTGYLGMAEDITELKEREREIKNYLQLIDKNIITSSTDINGNITFSSEAFSDISGYSKSELSGQNHRILKHEDMKKNVYKNLWKTVNDNKTWYGELKNKKKDGGYYWVSTVVHPLYGIDGKKTGYTAIKQDITDKKTVELLSITDGLTNLYNRRHFNATAQIEVDRARRLKSIFAFTLLDIDNFKKYNDAYGHQEGDNALLQIANALKEVFQRSHDVVFRLGGEEFGAIFTANSINHVREVVEHARANIEALKIEHTTNLPSKVVTASFGVVVAYVNDFTKKFQIESIYKNADDLLYEAKESGRNKIVIKEI